jgi:GntR family transcriptional regulator
MITISHHNPQPLYHQIQSQIRLKIVSGDLKSGTPLPSIRQLAEDLTTSVITTKRAYYELEREGLIMVRPGLGTFVAQIDARRIREAKTRLAAERIGLAIAEVKQMGLPDEEILGVCESVLDGRETPDNG